MTNFYFWCISDFGDGTNSSLTFVDFVNDDEFVVNHTYSTPSPTAFLNLTCYNYVSNVTLTDLIMLQTPISNVSIGTSLSAYPTNSSVPLSIYMTEGSHFNITVDYDDNIVNTYSVYASSVYSSEIILYHTYRIHGKYNVSVTVYNLISSVIASLSNLIIIQDVIDGFVFSLQTTAAAANEVVHINATLTVGSDVAIQAAFGNGDVVTYTNNFDPMSKIIMLNYTYAEVGNYTINATAFNLVSQQQANMTIVIQERIVALNLTGNTSLIWPPAYGRYNVGLGFGQPLLEDVFCKWEANADGIISTFFVPILDQNLPHIYGYTFNKSNAGVNQISVNCTNLISWQRSTIQVTVVLDEVILGPLTCLDSFVWWNFTANFSLNVTRFGTGSCFQWNMGDESRGVVYGVASCSPYAIGNQLQFHLIQPNVMTVSHLYVYPKLGKYQVSVRAFTPINNATASVKVNIVEWKCLKPNLTIDAKFKSISNPFPLPRSEHLNISANASIYCLGGIDRYEWKVYDLYKRQADPHTSPLIFYNSSGLFQYISNSLPYELYEIEVEVSMESSYFNFTPFSDVGFIFLNITKTPLKINFPAASYIVVPFNENLTFDGMNSTTDPDIAEIPENKTSMVFSWSCKRVSESWPLIPSFVEVGLFSGQSGCFGQGPGIIQTKNGYFNLSTSFMQPLVNYSIRLEVTKDTRYSVFDLTIFVDLAKPPLIQLTWVFFTMFICNIID